MGLSLKNRKRIIAILLGITSILTSWLLLSYDPPATKHLTSFARADSILKHELREFNIESQQVKQVHLEIDSNFTRKVYHVYVPPAFSQTQLHASINRAFHPYSISTPATVNMRARSMKIHIFYAGTVIRSLHVHADTSLIRHRKPASILVAFDEPPSASSLEELISFGEPIPLVFRVTGALEAERLQNNYEDRYEHIGFWFREDNGESLLDADVQISNLQPLRRFGKLSPRSRVLSFIPDTLVSQSLRKWLSNQPLEYIRAHQAIRVDVSNNRQSFNRIMHRFEQEAQQHRHPVLLLRGNDHLLKWTHEAILQFKKRGLMILQPPKNSY